MVGVHSARARTSSPAPPKVRVRTSTLHKVHLALTGLAGLAAVGAIVDRGEHTVVWAAAFGVAVVACGLRAWARATGPEGWVVLAGACVAAVVAHASGGLSFDLSAEVTNVASWASNAFVVLAATGAVLVIRPRVDPVSPRMAIDGLATGLAAAALVALLHRGALDFVNHDDAAFLGLHPMLAVTLVAVVAGLVGMANGRAGRTWLLLAPALLVWGEGLLAMTAHAMADGNAAPSWIGLLNGVWPVGAALLAGAALLDDEDEPVHVNDEALVSAPALGAGLSLLLLAYSLYEPLGVTVTVPALLASSLVVVRGMLTILDVRALTDSRRQARTDDLTGLANRRYFYERMEDALADRDPADGLAILVIDLDRFKEINDSLGHHTGDQILRLIGPRLTPAVGVWDLLARLGGDEFAVLVEGGDLEWAMQTARQLRTALADHFPVGEVHLHVDASIGIAMWPEHADSLDELLARADIAMYRAKAERSGIRTYEDNGDAPTVERLHLLELLRGAVRSEDPAAAGLVLHYQPKLHVETGNVEGVEALVRFDHPDGTLLFPDRFIAMVENAGLMQELTLSVLRTGLRQCREWRRQGIALTVAVNVSTSNLLDLAFPHQVMELLKHFDLPPTALLIEITESSFMQDRVRCLDVLHRLRAIGVKISVDDYGTGHSSLAYLRDLPADELKLDRSFVVGMAEDHKISSIVESTVKLAHALDLRIVAEGVETDDDLDRLRRFGTDVVQGYLFSRPLSARDFTDWYVSTYLDGVAPEPEPEPEPVPEPVATDGRTLFGTTDEELEPSNAGSVYEPEYEMPGIEWISIEEPSR